MSDDQSFYVICPEQSDLVACSEEQACPEADICAPHAYQDAEGNWHPHGDFCVAPDNCHQEVNDLGIAYIADCPLVSTLVSCDTDEECIQANDESWLCAPFSVV